MLFHPDDSARIYFVWDDYSEMADGWANAIRQDLERPFGAEARSAIFFWLSSRTRSKRWSMDFRRRSRHLCAE